MNEAFARVCSTGGTKEGVTAFFQKRNPKWQEKYQMGCISPEEFGPGSDLLSLGINSL